MFMLCNKFVDTDNNILNYYFILLCLVMKCSACCSVFWLWVAD